MEVTVAEVMTEDGDSKAEEEMEEDNNRDLHVRVVALINSRLGGSLADVSAIAGYRQELAEKLHRVETRYSPTNSVFCVQSYGSGSFLTGSDCWI